MNAPSGERPILIVKRVKKAQAAHHGGAWKVAYADFVTAMMAFFMVMWLIAAVSKEQRAAIFDYFKNPSMTQGKSPRASQSQIGPGGASTSVINLHGGLDARKSSSPISTGLGTPRDTPNSEDKSAPDVETAKKIAEQADRKKLESLLAQLREAIDHSQALRPFKDQLLLDITPEGLRIQIVDSQNRPMFDLGSAKLKDYTGTILHELAPYLNSVPNRISLSGHTDTTAYLAGAGYTNWDLSADRANAARRALEGGGLQSDKVSRVVGLSSSVLFDKDNSRNPINRRISIIVMTKEADESALKTDAPTSASAAPAADAPAGAIAPSAADAATSAAATAAPTPIISGAAAGSDSPAPTAK
ncbi:MAG TPA: flagellar motor protein MotB [Steroidobacteraceae bacterium]|jgi:chemotaxis protein MotB